MVAVLVRFVLLGVLWSSLFSGYTRSELSPRPFSSLRPFSCGQTPRTWEVLRMGTPDGKPKPLVNLCLSWTEESTLPVFGTGDTPVRQLLPQPEHTNGLLLSGQGGAEPLCPRPVLGWFVNAR